MRKIGGIILLMWVLALPANAQLTGVVIDASCGEGIPNASVVYKGHKMMVKCDAWGHFSMERNDGLKIVVSAVGFQPAVVNINEKTTVPLTVSLKPDAHQLKELVVKSKKRRYKRKGNPAVEMMRKVIAAKKLTNLDNHDYYQFDKYQRITFALSDLSESQLNKGIFKKIPILLKHVEQCPYNDKMMLPLSEDETVTRKLYRRSPHQERSVVLGQKSVGVNNLFETGDLLTATLKNVFRDVNIYDNQIRLLRHVFTSPIGKDAIGFYRYYIEDTLMVDSDKCYKLSFLPNNQQDFGFSGELFVLADSSWQVKECELNIPRNSDVNFVNDFRVIQKFTKTRLGERVLSVDEMMAELALSDKLQKVLVIRNTNLSNYSFDAIPSDSLIDKDRYVSSTAEVFQNDKFWSKYSGNDSVARKNGVNSLASDLKNVKGFGSAILLLRLVMENYIETGSSTTPSKVDIGPVITFVSSNFIDGLRMRLGGQTTANLNPHLFFSGYYAHGWKSKNDYYKASVTYSFNCKKNQPYEFPKRTVSFTSSYDVGTPSDKFMRNDKDNMFTALKAFDVNKMMFYRTQDICMEHEWKSGFKLMVDMKMQDTEPTGDLSFVRLYQGENVRHLRTSELTLGMGFTSGETYINTKQHRRTINDDAFNVEVNHTVGLSGILGGQYRYNHSEASIYKCIWVNSWGKIKVLAKAGVEWNKVPFPLLIMPAANLSYISNEGMFNLMNNMEFLNDRFVSLDLNWNLNGKLFNRIPLMKKLKWREYVGFKMLYGGLSDKNNPYLSSNKNDGTLFMFPSTTNVMDEKKPYCEFSVGICNIFKFFQVEYIRRLSYLQLPTATKSGVRMKVNITF